MSEITCPSCGKTFDDNGKGVCPHCGTATRAEPAPPTPREERMPAKRSIPGDLVAGRRETASRASTGIGAVIAALVVTVFTLAPAAGSEGLGALFGGGMGGRPFGFKLDFEYGASSDAKVVGQGTDFGLARYGVSTTARLFKTERDSVTLSMSNHVLAINTAATLPATGALVPDEFQNVRLGLAFSRRFEMGRSITTAINIGSASDDPFGGNDRQTFSWILSYMRPTKPGKAWILGAMMTNTFEELNYIPIPMIAYMSRGERHTTIVGLPFASVNWRPAERWSFDFSYFPMTNVRAMATYKPTKQLGVYAGLDSRRYTFFRSGRALDDDRFYVYETCVALGVSAFVSRHASIDLSGGWSFGRYMFEGESWTDRDMNRVDIEGAFALQLKASMFW